MRFKVDENLPVEIGEDLRLLGHAADTVAEESLRGAADSRVVELARLERRVLLTLDIGNRQFVKLPAPAPCWDCSVSTRLVGPAQCTRVCPLKDVTSAGDGVGRPPRGRDRDANSDQVGKGYTMRAAV